MEQLQFELADLIRDGSSVLLDEVFSQAALQLFQHHQQDPGYARFCSRRLGGRSPQHWREIPLLPSDAFKMARIAVLSDGPTTEFRSSGTTQNRRSSGLLDEPAMDLMKQSVLANARNMLFCDDVPRRMMVLAPRIAEAPHMIMAQGIEWMAQTFDADAEYYVSEGRLATERLAADLDEANRTNHAVCMIGASFCFVELADWLNRHENRDAELPAGSLLVDAGGYKGRCRDITAEEFRASMRSCFGIDDSQIVNLLGMTELSSQIYDDSHARRVAGKDAGRQKAPPPWMRTRVINPERTNEDVAVGEMGVLAHYDLANLSRPMALLSGDLGIRTEAGFQFAGRVTQEARGCSVSMEDILKAGRAA